MFNKEGFYKMSHHHHHHRPHPDPHNFNLLKFEHGVLQVGYGQSQVFIKLPFSPFYCWLKVISHNHCGGPEDSTATWEFDGNELIITYNVTSEEATIIFFVVGE